MKNVMIIFISVVFTLFLISCDSCDNRGGTSYRIIAKGILSKKFSLDESFVYSSPDGAGLTFSTYKLVVMNNDDTVGYDKEYPVQTTLLNRNKLIDSAKIGDSVAIFNIERQVFLTKYSNLEAAISFAQRQNEFRWPVVLSRTLFLVLPLLLIAIIGIILFVFDISIESESLGSLIAIVIVILGFVLGIILMNDIEILY